MGLGGRGGVGEGGGVGPGGPGGPWGPLGGPWGAPLGPLGPGPGPGPGPYFGPIFPGWDFSKTSCFTVFSDFYKVFNSDPRSCVSLTGATFVLLDVFSTRTLPEHLQLTEVGQLQMLWQCAG